MPAVRKNVGLGFVVIDSSILFTPGGQVWRWMDELADDTAEAAKDNAPPRRSNARHGTWSRVGNLRNSIRGETPDITGPRQMHVDVSANAINSKGQHYAYYVHEGTANDGTGWIVAHGKLMPVTRIPFKTTYHQKVRGQKANPFLVDGFNSVARRRGLGARMY